MIGNIIRKDSEKGACKLAPDGAPFLSHRVPVGAVPFLGVSCSVKSTVSREEKSERKFLHGKERSVLRRAAVVQAARRGSLPDGAHQKPVRSAASRAFCKAKGDKCLRKVGMVLAILSIFFNLLGCSKKTGYTAADLSVLSTVCGHMCRNYSYSFSLIKDNGTWLFSTNCFVNNKEFSAEIENCPITEEETLKFLRIVDEQKLISSIRRYRKPALYRHFFVCDETMYSSSIRFANGAEYNAEMSVGTEMTDFFYRLAEKYF